MSRPAHDQGPQLEQTRSDPRMSTTEPSHTMDPRPCWVRVSRRLDASPARVHRFWSDPEELASWFPRQVEGSLTVGARSVLTWHDRRVPIEVLASVPAEPVPLPLVVAAGRQHPDRGHGPAREPGLRDAADDVRRAVRRCRAPAASRPTPRPCWAGARPSPTCGPRSTSRSTCGASAARVLRRRPRPMPGIDAPMPGRDALTADAARPSRTPRA